MTDTEVLEIITSHDVNWKNSWEEHQINYHAIANIGRELVLDVKNQKNLDRVRNVLNDVESILKNAEQNELDLIGAGLFECMQTNALNEFSSDSMDSLNDFLGSTSLEMWQDILEGWHGEGIRSMEEYSKILVNGGINEVFVHLYETNSSFEISGEMLGNDFTPFKSDRFIRHRNYDEPISLPYVKLYFPEIAEIIIGGHTDSSEKDRYIYDDTCRVHIISSSKIYNLMKKLKHEKSY